MVTLLLPHTVTLHKWDIWPLQHHQCNACCRCPHLWLDPQHLQRQGTWCSQAQSGQEGEKWFCQARHLGWVTPNIGAAEEGHQPTLLKMGLVVQASPGWLSRHWMVLLLANHKRMSTLLVSWLQGDFWFHCTCWTHLHYHLHHCHLWPWSLLHWHHSSIPLSRHQCTGMGHLTRCLQEWLPWWTCNYSQNDHLWSQAIQ